MPRKIRPIDRSVSEEETQDVQETLSEEEAMRQNDEILKKEIAEFDRIAEDLKLKEKARLLAMAKKGAAKPSRRTKEDAAAEISGAEDAAGNAKQEDFYKELEDAAKAEIAKHVRAREAALKAMKKAPVTPAQPAPEGPFHDLRVKHVRDPVEEEDGTRLLVERVWPRGLNRKTYPMTDWQPAVGPTLALRKEFADNPDKFAAFSAGYRAFLSKEPAALEFKTEIRTILQVENVTFLYAEGGADRNSAAVLKEWVLE